MTSNWTNTWKKIVSAKPLDPNVGEVEKVNGTETIGPVVTKALRPPNAKRICTAVSLSDQHIPFQDKAVERQIFAWLKDYQPDTIIINGDLVDFYSISSFLKDPKRKETLQDEINQAIIYISRLRATCPNATLHYNLGNHENRLKRYLLSNAKALDSLDALKFPNLLKLRDNDVLLHEQGLKLNRNLLITHGTRISKHSGSTARAEFETHLSSGVSGHTHRVGRYDVVGTGGSFTWVEQGCLCDMDPEYMDHKPNWQQGFALIEYGAHKFSIREQRIFDRKLVIDGKSYA